MEKEKGKKDLLNSILGEPGMAPEVDPYNCWKDPGHMETP